MRDTATTFASPSFTPGTGGGTAMRHGTPVTVSTSVLCADRITSTSVSASVRNGSSSWDSTTSMDSILSSGIVTARVIFPVKPSPVPL